MENDQMIMSDHRLINYFYLDQILISSVAFTKVIYIYIYRFREGKKEALIWSFKYCISEEIQFVS